MKKFTTSVLIAVSGILLFAGIPNPVLADDHEKDEKQTATTKKNRPYPFRGKISAIDKKAKSITLQGKEKSRIFYLNKDTKIQKHGKPATLDDAVIGDEAGGSVVPDANGKLVLKSVRFGPKPTTEKPTEKSATKDK